MTKESTKGLAQRSRRARKLSAGFAKVGNGQPKNHRRSSHHTRTLPTTSKFLTNPHQHAKNKDADEQEEKRKPAAMTGNGCRVFFHEVDIQVCFQSRTILPSCSGGLSREPSTGNLSLARRLLKPEIQAIHPGLETSG